MNYVLKYFVLGDNCIIILFLKRINMIFSQSLNYRNSTRVRYIPII